MKSKEKFWARWLTNIAVNRPWWTLLIVAVITAISLVLTSHLEMRMSFKDLLPQNHPVVQSYNEMQERFGEGSIVIALEGERGEMVAMAEALVPELEKMESLYNVQSEMPQDFIRDHGFVMMKPDMFKRSLKMFADRSLVGTFQGMNDDYESEYTDSESNLKRDETEIARSLLGITRSLEILRANFAGRKGVASVEEAVDAFALGEPWMLSLDRKMLLITCVPVEDMINNISEVLVTVEEVETLTQKINLLFPKVEANLTGMARIGLDEMNSVGLYTQLLSLAALILIYFLLARTLKNWTLPVITLIPLLIGIFWTFGLLYLLFGSLNMFTAMIMLILIGLGIDFSIHLLSRFRESLSTGSSVEDSLMVALGDTGTAIITGAMTTSFAFFALMIADMQGIFEFGVASGAGIMLTLIAIFVTLPALLVLQQRRIEKRRVRKAERLKKKDKTAIPDTIAPNPDAHAYNWIGAVARSSWNKNWIFLTIAVIFIAFSVRAMKQIEFEYDFLKLEPAGLMSVHLQREIPKRFGIADHFAWLVTDSIEESRQLKEKLRKKSLIGEVVSISDYIPSEERIKNYTPQLEQFRRDILKQNLPGWNDGDAEKLAVELDRLWDNLDLMSNLAYTAGLDRIVKVIDQLTGYDTESNTTDTTAVLPSLTRMLRRGVDEYRAESIAEDWGERMTTNIYSMADPTPVTLDELPEVVRKIHLPREGEGYLLAIYPRKYLFNRRALEAFAEQTESVHHGISGSEKLFLLMMDKTLEEGGKAAWLALAVIAVLLLIYFRGPVGLLAMIPLATGALTMIGLMYLIGMKYNYMNMIAVPIILGIGIDDGVHVLHRFRHQAGNGALRIFNSYRFVGRAILLTSLTTMIGFGSIAFYTMRGMASFGQVLFMGVGACFLTSVLVLPAVLRVFYGKQKRLQG